MATNSKKRSREEFASDSKEMIEDSPSKKAKLDDKHHTNCSNLGRNILEQSITDLKDPSNLTFDKLKKLFAINTSQLDNRYQVYQHFKNLSLALTRDLLIILSPKKKLYQFVEFEFYCLDDGHHQDVFAHCDDLQLNTNASFYFHRSGNNSVNGYKYVTDNTNKRWINPRSAAKYRGGTFKGLDITFGAKDTSFGGILIRSIREMIPLNPAFTNNDNKVYSPSNIIEGPCKCVDHILKQTGFKDIESLTNSKQFNLSIFGDERNPIYVDLANKYEIKELSPKRSHKNKDDIKDNKDIKYEEYFHHSPRVGLTLKKEKHLHGTELQEFENLKKDYVMAPYRCIRTPCLSKIKKYKQCIALSLIYRDYYYNKVNDKQANDKVSNKEGLILYNSKQLDNLIEQCQYGQKESAKTVKDAQKKFPTNNNGLSKLFGALM